MNPYTPTKRRAILLLSILLITAGCAATKQDTKSSTLQQTTHLQAAASRQSDTRDSLRRQKTEQIDSSSYILTISTDAIPQEKVQLSIPVRELGSLPQGASFRTHSGRTSIQAEIHNDTLIVIGKSDSIARTRYRVENRTIRRQFASDTGSLRRAVSGNEEHIQTERLDYRLLAEKQTEKKHSRLGWIIGIASTIIVILWLCKTSIPQLLWNFIKRRI